MATRIHPMLSRHAENAGPHWWTRDKARDAVFSASIVQSMVTLFGSQEALSEAAFGSPEHQRALSNHARGQKLPWLRFLRLQRAVEARLGARLDLDKAVEALDACVASAEFPALPTDRQIELLLSTASIWLHGNRLGAEDRALGAPDETTPAETWALAWPWADLGCGPDHDTVEGVLLRTAEMQADDLGAVLSDIVLVPNRQPERGLARPLPEPRDDEFTVTLPAEQASYTVHVHTHFPPLSRLTLYTFEHSTPERALVSALQHLQVVAEDLAEELERTCASIDLRDHRPLVAEGPPVTDPEFPPRVPPDLFDGGVTDSASPPESP
jgi:hypothetical protein